jgi:hypothetical protein
MSLLLKIWAPPHISTAPGLWPGQPALTPAGPAYRPVDRLIDRQVRYHAQFDRPVRRLAQSFAKLRLNTCIYAITFGLLISDDMYTYPTIILTLFALLQEILMRTHVVLLPREAGKKGLQGAVQALVCPLEQLREVVQGVQLGVEASQ